MGQKFRYNKKALLCIGGPYAGKLYSAPDKEDHFRVVVNKPLKLIDYGSKPENTVIGVIFVYVKRAINTPEGSIVFWTPEDQTLAETLMILFGSYTACKENHETLT